VIEALTDLPDGVIGFEVSGKLVASDYTDVMLPAVLEAAERGKIRLVLVIAGFDGLSGGAVWQDLKLGVEHLRAWKRVAVVTDLEWMTHLLALFGWMTPGEVSHFPMAERAEAVAWAAG
jgi:hypothetical protein